MFNKDRHGYQPLLEEGETVILQRSRLFKKRAAVLSVILVLGVCLCLIIVLSLVKTRSRHENNEPDFILPEGEVVLSQTNGLGQVKDNSHSDSSHCPIPPISPHDIESFSGTWFEVVKIETPTSQIFQEGCHCTTLEFTVRSDVNNNTDADVFLSCNDERVYGQRIGIHAKMEAMQDVGSWKQRVFIKQSYWHLVIHKEDYAMAYECMVTDSGKPEYGIHVFSRHPENLDMDIISLLLSSANQIGLNPLSLDAQFIDQTSDICAEE